MPTMGEGIQMTRTTHVFLLAALLGLALPAAATELPAAVDYRPPAEGLVIEYSLIDGDDRYTLTTEVLAAEGDDVVLKSSVPARQTERYFRFLLVRESAGDYFRFDEAALAGLWPLRPGKSLRLPVEGSIDGAPVLLELAFVVEAIEEVLVPAGRFAAARVSYAATLGPGGALASFRVTSWLDAERSLPVRVDVTYSTADRGAQTFRLVAQALR